MFNGLPVLRQRHAAQGRARAPAPARTSAAGSTACRRRSPTSRRVYTLPRTGFQLKADWHWVRLAPGGPDARDLAPGLQLLQLRRGLCAAEHGHAHQRRPAERVSEQGSRGRQPAAADHGRQPDLPRPAHPAAAVHRSRCRTTSAATAATARSQRRAWRGHPARPGRPPRRRRPRTRRFRPVATEDARARAFAIHRQRPDRRGHPGAWRRGLDIAS